MSEESLEEFRGKIDEIDEKIIDLLSQRIELAKKILEIKESKGREVRNMEREQEVVEKVRRRAKERGLDPEFAESIIRLTIYETAAVEREMVGGAEIWVKVRSFFEGNPAQLKVARILYKYGFRVGEDGDILCGDIRVPAVQIAEEAAVDRRAVDSTSETILNNGELREVFSNLRPVPFLKGIARQLGLGLIEIIPSDATQVGIISEVTNVISKHGLSVRQSIANDPYFTTQPKLTIITQELIPGEVIEELRELPSVESVIVY